MSNDQTRTRQMRQQLEASDAAQETGGPSPLVEQAQAWAKVAREAHEECVKGEQAERALHQRRNTSGQ